MFFERVRLSKNNNSNRAVSTRSANFRSCTQTCAIAYEFSDNMLPGDVTTLGLLVQTVKTCSDSVSASWFARFFFRNLQHHEYGHNFPQCCAGTLQLQLLRTSCWPMAPLGTLRKLPSEFTTLPVQSAFDICGLEKHAIFHCYKSYSWHYNHRHVWALFSCVGTAFFFFTLDAGLLARSQYPEGPATGHLDTGFSWFRCA